MDQIIFDLDSQEAKGRVDIGRGGYGIDIRVNGEEDASCWLDLFHPAQGTGFPQYLLYDSRLEEPVVKVVLENGGATVIVNGHDLQRLRVDHPQGIHSDGTDLVFRFDP